MDLEKNSTIEILADSILNNENNQNISLSSLTSGLTTATAAATPGVTLTTATNDLTTSSWILEAIKVVFGYVPRTLYKMLSSTLSLTVTLDFWGMLNVVLFSLFIFILWWRFVFISSKKAKNQENARPPTISSSCQKSI
jgi:hypothetical protein